MCGSCHTWISLGVLGAKHTVMRFAEKISISHLEGSSVLIIASVANSCRGLILSLF
jgi:hypothetical protein